MSDLNPGFLSGYMSAVPLAQRQAVNDLMQERRRLGFIVDKMQMISEAKDKIEFARSNGKNFVFDPVFPGQRISSENINRMFEDIYLDLKTLYTQMGIISSIKNRVNTATNDDFIKTKGSIVKAINELRLFNFLKKNPQYQDAKYIDFNNAINKTGFNPKAYVDTSVKKLKLPANVNQRYGADRFNLDFATAEVTVYGGGISSGNSKGFGIENTLDSNPENFWAMTVLADGIPQHRIDLSHSAEERALGSGLQYGNIYESNGIIFEVVYNFSKTIHTNNVKIMPISDYPVRVIDICYKTSDSATTWIPMPGFDPADYEETLEWLEWNGQRTACTSIKILLEQQNYNANIYQVPASLVNNNQLWHQVIDGSYNELFHSIELDQVTADKIALGEDQVAYLNEVSEVAKDIIKAKITGKNLREYEIIDSVKSATAARMGKAIPDEAKSYVNTFMQRELAAKDALVEVRKYQYTCGLRFVEFNDITYQPFAYYESPYFESNANILEVSLDTAEEHEEAVDAITGEKFRKTSIEYEIELSDSRIIPILPVGNLFEGDNGYAARVRDELIIANRTTFAYVCRFPMPQSTTGLPGVQIRKNGRRLSPMVINSGYRASSPLYNYTITTETTGSYQYIKVTFNARYFDPRAIYTINYIADASACTVDINSLLDSEYTPEPEQFDATDRNNAVKLKYFPYIEYEIINNSQVWQKTDEVNQRWLFGPYTQNYSKGVASLVTGDSRFVSGFSTLWADDGVKDLVTGSYYSISGASIKFAGDTNVYRITGTVTNSGFYVDSDISTGFIQSGSSLTGLSYVIGRTTEIDGTVYGLGNHYYDPLNVFVNDIKATNLTNYATLTHQAFNVHDGSSRIYEYLQAGKYIYFNAPVNGKIEVNYSYLTKYIKLNAVLRAHTQLNPYDTPILKNYTVRIKNSRI